MAREVALICGRGRHWRTERLLLGCNNGGGGGGIVLLAESGIRLASAEGHGRHEVDGEQRHGGKASQEEHSNSFLVVLWVHGDPGQLLVKLALDHDK